MDPFFFFFTRFKVLERIWLRLYANEQNIIYTVHNFTLVTSGQIGKNFKLYDFHSVLQKKKKKKTRNSTFYPSRLLLSKSRTKKNGEYNIYIIEGPEKKKEKRVFLRDAKVHEVGIRGDERDRLIDERIHEGSKV